MAVTQTASKLLSQQSWTGMGEETPHHLSRIERGFLEQRCHLGHFNVDGKVLAIGEELIKYSKG